MKICAGKADEVARTIDLKSSVVLYCSRDEESSLEFSIRQQVIRF